MQMTLAQYHQQLTQSLNSIGNQTAELDGRLLICDCLQIDFTQFILQQDRTLTIAETTALNGRQQQAMTHMPISRIVKIREFWGLDFQINEHVLDPRADSETLVETILHFVPPSSKNLKFLDLGTGSGCLLLSLLSEYKSSTGIGADYSAQALDVAQQNAHQLGLADRANFIQSDWFTQIPSQKFDVILSNPPYIPSRDIDGLAKNVKLYDPLSALDGGGDGLDPYHIIAQQAAQYLNPNGILIFEMGHDQAAALFDILAQNGFHSDVFTMPRQSQNHAASRNGLAFDLGGNPRIIISQFK